VGTDVFVALRSYHVFKHPGMRLLVCTGGTDVAVSFGLVLARALDGPVTLLGVGEDAHECRLLQNWLEEIARIEREHAPGITIATRLGDPAEGILAELEENPYELCVIGTPGGSAVGRTAARVAQELRLPVAIVPVARAMLKRILICTPAAAPAAAAPADLRPAEALHLEKGLMTLGRLTVTGQAKVRYGNVVDEIFAEADAGDYDLIVIGAHTSGARGLGPDMLPNDVAHAVVTSAKLPVLMVPLRAL
jgi:nucleotide-binding universal stress UspA family protein